jgi:hypothetical protein
MKAADVLKSLFQRARAKVVNTPFRTRLRDGTVMLVYPFQRGEDPLRMPSRKHYGIPWLRKRRMAAAERWAAGEPYRTWPRRDYVTRFEQTFEGSCASQQPRTAQPGPRPITPPEHGRT